MPSKTKIAIITDRDYFHRIDDFLRRKFGNPDKSYFDPTASLVKGILSQNTTDINRDRAFENLINTFRDWEDILNSDEKLIANSIRIAGMSNQRATRIKNLLHWLKEQNKGEIDAEFLLNMEPKLAMDKLLKLHGIGIKTASVFLLFCCGAPFFPVDTHIKRLMVRFGVYPRKTSAERMIVELSEIIPSELHYRLHLNLITLGREICKARNAQCEICPLDEVCSKCLK